MGRGGGENKIKGKQTQGKNERKRKPKLKGGLITKEEFFKT
jgi:hypothetical protein